MHNRGSRSHVFQNYLQAFAAKEALVRRGLLPQALVGRLPGGPWLQRDLITDSWWRMVDYQITKI